MASKLEDMIDSLSVISSRGQHLTNKQV